MSAVPSAVDTRPPASSGGAAAFWKRLRAGDEIAIATTFLSAFTVILVTAVLVFELYQKSAISRHAFGWSFLTSTTWDPVAGNFGALPFIYGTLVTTALAMIVGIPLGVGAAIFLAELAPPLLSSALSFLIELLAAVPSVIIGLLGIFVMIPILQQIVPPVQDKLSWIPLFSGPFYGVSLFTAGVVLAIMILPFIISISREVILSVPNDQREGALALGATRWETTWNVVVPYARKGIAGSIFLALARAMGETMAVTMVVGNDPKIAHSLMAPGYSIAAVIANEFAEATGDLYQGALIELGLVLFGVTIIVNGAARLLVMSTEKRGSS
ncbi:MAG TPA: phosphate ABC transporter permease subunit PstC [Bryobacteraceae bacterium]|nr:phosphate ABC transporter permease subunit PstC [Bryobacteraceae bacterium]